MAEQPSPGSNPDTGPSIDSDARSCHSNPENYQASSSYSESEAHHIVYSASDPGWHDLPLYNLNADLATCAPRYATPFDCISSISHLESFVHRSSFLSVGVEYVRGTRNISAISVALLGNFPHVPDVDTTRQSRTLRCFINKYAVRVATFRVMHQLWDRERSEHLVSSSSSGTEPIFGEVPPALVPEAEVTFESLRTALAAEVKGFRWVFLKKPLVGLMHNVNGLEDDTFRYDSEELRGLEPLWTNSRIGLSNLLKSESIAPPRAHLSLSNMIAALGYDWYPDLRLKDGMGAADKAVSKLVVLSRLVDSRDREDFARGLYLREGIMLGTNISEFALEPYRAHVSRLGWQLPPNMDSTVRLASWASA
ncbi:hypothetical protein F4802DRAFT_506820 [Xylaria palmicola]|nr:hypothetical protein F4802DRAFT_506820 [Xylaria palmicola]